MSKNKDSYLKVVVGALIILGLMTVFLMTKIYSLSNPSTGKLIPDIDPQSGGLLAIFLTGLLTGGLTCLAVQGGLLASTIAMQEENHLRQKALSGKGKLNTAVPILSFLTAKLIAYTLLGFLLGWFGSLFKLSLTAQVIMQFAVIIFMLGTAGNILEIHPFFRYFAIQPPRFLAKMVRNQSKSNSIFAPAFLGALTVFIPCGTTQAMMALSIGSGKPLMGAAILFAFILGTTPLFFILGYFATRLGEKYQKRFMRVAAVTLILLAVFNFKNTLNLTGVNLNKSAVSADKEVAENPTIEFYLNGYDPQSINVKAGADVNLTLKNVAGGGCIQSFVIPKLGIQKIVRQGSTEVVQFKAPTQKGQISFMCGMGMYRGVINVI